MDKTNYYQIAYTWLQNLIGYYFLKQNKNTQNNENNKTLEWHWSWSDTEHSLNK